jgi:serine/threonine-protein kinase
MSFKNNRLVRFWQQLKQRKVIHVIVVYATSAFVIIELINNVYKPLDLPSWTPTMVIIILLAGLPFAIIFSWIFNVPSRVVSKADPSGKDSLKDAELKEIIGEQVQENSIVILPFKDMSPEKDNEYFCDGITEEIINVLTKIKDLYVVARTSSFAFKGQNVDVREIGKKLNVETLLEGSVRKSDNTLRITAQLINIENGFHIWSESYDREVSEIFAIQDEISIQIVNKLKVSIGSNEAEMVSKRSTENLEAYNLYLKGRYFWNKLSEEGLRKGMDFFRQATQIDPEYALAYSGISDTYCRIAWYSYGSPAEAFPKAKEAAEKALELNKALPEAYASLCFVSMCFDRDYEKAFEQIATAIDLDPGFAGAYTYYSICLAITGKHQESIEVAKRALDLDPLTPMMQINLGGRYYYARQYDKCIANVLKTLEMDPGFDMAHYYLAYFYNQKKEHEKALEEINKVISVFGRNNTQFLAALAIILAYMNDTEGAEQVIGEMVELSKDKYTSFFWLGAIYVVLGKKDKAFQMFEKAYNAREVLMIFLNVDPIFDGIKPDPRFQALLKKMNFSS